MIMWWWCWAAAQASEPVQTWELGLGVRSSLVEEGPIDGARLIGRRRVGQWSGELSAYASPWAARCDGLASVLVQIAEGDYQHPVDHDRASLSALGVWHTWADRGRGARRASTPAPTSSSESAAGCGRTQAASSSSTHPSSASRPARPWAQASRSSWAGSSLVWWSQTECASHHQHPTHRTRRPTA